MDFEGFMKAMQIISEHIYSVDYKSSFEQLVDHNIVMIENMIATSERGASGS